MVTKFACHKVSCLGTFFAITDGLNL